MRTMKRAGIAAAALAVIGIVAVVWVLTKEVVFQRNDKGKIEWDQVEVIDQKQDQLFGFPERDITAVDIAVREVDYSSIDEDEKAAIEGLDEEEAAGGETEEQAAKTQAEAAEVEEAPEAAPKPEVHERKLGLAKVGGKWMLTAPLHALADQGAADGVAKAIADLRIQGRYTDRDPLDPEYGLNNPCVIAKVKRKRGKELEIRIGRDTKIGSDVYLMVAGDRTLYYAASSAKTSLTKEPKDLREKTVVEFDKDKVERVVLDTKGTRIVCEQVGKADAQEWWLNRPVKARADNFAVTDIIDDIKGVEAKEFVDDVKSLSQFGLDKPSVVARLDFGKDIDDVVLKLGKRISKKLEDDTSYSADTGTGGLTDLVYCMAEGRDEVFLVDASIADSLEKDPIDFRDTTIVDFENSKLTRVSIDRKRGDDFELVHADAKWRIEKPEFANADDMKVDDLLWNIKDLKAADFLDEDVSPQVSGLTNPEVSISLYSEGEDEPLVIKFGYQEKGGIRYYCQTSKMRTPCLVAGTWQDPLPKSIDDLKKDESEEEKGDTDMPGVDEAETD